MSANFHFYTIKAEKFDAFKTLPVDDLGGYAFYSDPDTEDLSMPTIWHARTVYKACDRVDSLMRSRSPGDPLASLYRMYFGNMYWSGDDEFRLRDELYLKDAWGLRQTKNGTQEFFSLNLDALTKIISLEPEINYRLISPNSTDDFTVVTREWLGLYKHALQQNRCVVFDLG